MKLSKHLSIQSKHETHQAVIKLDTTAHHYARLHCVECNKWVKWLTREETNIALELGLVEDNEPRKTAKDFWNEV